MGLNFDCREIRENGYEACFGLEKESLRIDEDGFLAHTEHPFKNDPFIDRDFCENQVEIVTGVCQSTGQLFDEIKRLHETVVDKLTENHELLWCFSNPPYVKGEEDIPVARFSGTLKSKELYRNYLAQKYGKRKMLYSGIHFNYSFGENLLQAGFRNSSYKDFGEYKDYLYLSLAKRIVEYSWLIVYLTAASPVVDGSFLDDNAIGKTFVTPYASARCGKNGYRNQFIPVLQYDSIFDYTKSIQRYVTNGMLKSASELYYPVRLKPRGENSLENLAENGVNHIELRMLDLNPLSPVGIAKEDIDFLHLLLMYLSSLPDEDFPEEKQILCIENSMSGALLDDQHTKINGVPLRKAALSALESIERFFKKYGNDTDLQTLAFQKEKVGNHHRRYADILCNEYGTDFVGKGIALSKKYADRKEVCTVV